MVHAWYTSKTNRVTEGVTTVEFSDISPDLGEMYHLGEPHRPAASEKTA